MVSAVLENLIAQLEKLPGIGRRSSERIAFHLLRTERELVFALAEAIRDLKLKLKHCSTCFNLTDIDPCTICSDPRRDGSIVCVVEQPRDLATIESTGSYNGLYHVLMGRLSPLEGVDQADLTIEALVKRVEEGQIKEVIMATNPTVEGDGTALYISNLLAELPVKITRLARGITTGSVLEYANKEMLSDALSGRQQF